MNDRIQELASQAGLYDFVLIAMGIDEELEKFAELLIRECMDVVRDINQEYDGGSTVVNAADEIAEYFGVE